MMTQITTNARSYKWQEWLVGIWRAAISGGAGAVVAAFGSMSIDPAHFNLAAGLGDTIKLMGVMFGFMAFIHIMMFLQTHATPELVVQKEFIKKTANGEGEIQTKITTTAVISGGTNEKPIDPHVVSDPDKPGV